MRRSMHLKLHGLSYPIKVYEDLESFSRVCLYDTHKKLTSIGSDKPTKEK